MVWAAKDGTDGRQDIHAVTFTPITPVQPFSPAEIHNTVELDSLRGDPTFVQITQHIQ